MKRILMIFMLLFLLPGCGNAKSSVKPGMELRTRLLNSDGCRFNAEITADYGTLVQCFTVECIADSAGNVEFTVVEPDVISGITGKISQDVGHLTFNDRALAFSLLADGQIAPVSSPWIFLKTLRSGYIRACDTNKNGTHLIIDDSYEDDALQLDVYLSVDNIPQQADILWRGKRILTISVKDFSFL